jgi:hypothetical protein
VFVLMSGRKAKDYKKVLKKILQILPTAPKVKQFTVDFEAAMWRALREVFPTGNVMGCLFHWTQALWWKIQEYGLCSAYKNDNATYRYLRQLMSLPFLPARTIQSMYEQLRPQASSLPLQKFVDYVGNTWVYSETYAPTNWSVYGKSIRTNNDVKGWHNGLNRRANGEIQLPFYRLVELLHREAKLASLQIRLVSMQKLKRLQRKKYRLLQAKIFAVWENYSSGEKSASQLLNAISYINGPPKPA